MKKYSLQLRLTVAVGLILVAVCALLTINSLFSANTYYGDYAKLLEEGLVEYDTAPTEEMGPAFNNNLINYNDVYQKFSFQSLLVMVVMIVLALEVTYWATGRMLRPLKTLTDSVKLVDGQNLDERMPLDKTGGEVLVLAEAYNRMLDRLQEAFMIQKSFASNAAHELKTPLAVIKSSLQVLEINPSPQLEDYKEFMSDTGQSLERIIKTVDGLLSLANPAAAPVDQSVELYPIVAQAVRELSGRAQAADVSVAFHDDTPLPVESVACDTLMTTDEGVQDTPAVSDEDIYAAPLAVKGNYSLLYRAVYNLIENAIKYNRPGGTVDVRLKKQADQICLTVQDSGVGMEEEVMGHIFEPFYRADPSRSQKIPGSGLGLAVVKMILERHDSTIEVESKPGAGTVFTIYLKAQEALKG